MASKDWKDLLGESFGIERDDKNATANSSKENGINKQQLRVELDKKGRNGKQATLISGFMCSEDEVKEIAKKIKTTCGVGGSTRDFEILIQGDFRKKISDMLEKDGHKVKRINF